MSTNVLEKQQPTRTPATIPSARGAVVAPPRPVLKPSQLPTIAMLAVPVAAACLVFAWTTALPLDLHEQALVLTPARLPPAARGIAEIAGASPRAWRALGALALALSGIAAAALARRFSRSPIAPLVAGGIVATHAAMLVSSASIEGSLRILAIAALLGSLVAWDRSLARKTTAAGLLALSCLLNPGFPPIASAHDAFLTMLNRRPDATPAAIAAAAAAAAALVLTAIFRLRSRGLRRFISCAAALALCAMGVGTALRQGAETRAARSEVDRFLSRLDALPPVSGDAAAEIILGPPAKCEDVSGARPLRRIAASIDSAAQARRLRILRFAQPGGDGLLSTLPPEITTVVEAEIDADIGLESPAPGATLAARTAEDEPEFRFSLQEIPADLGSVRIILIADSPGPTGVIVRDLEETIVRREGTPEKPELVWRPAWRPMSCPERELRWEDGDLCPRGGSFWWTVAVVDRGRTRMAPLRRASVLP